MSVRKIYRRGGTYSMAPPTLLPSRRDAVTPDICRDPELLCRYLENLSRAAQSSSRQIVEDLGSVQEEVAVLEQDREDAVVLAPGEIRRNVVRPTIPGAIGVGVRAHASQSADLFRAENKSKVRLWGVDKDGKAGFNQGTSINEYSTDGTLGDNSNDAVPTEQATKTYVDAQISALPTSVGIIASVTGIDLKTTTPVVLYLDTAGGSVLPTQIVLVAETVSGVITDPTIKVEVRDSGSVVIGKYWGDQALRGGRASRFWRSPDAAGDFTQGANWDILLTPTVAATGTSFIVTAYVMGYTL